MNTSLQVKPAGVTLQDLLELLCDDSGSEVTAFLHVPHRHGNRFCITAEADTRTKLLHHHRCVTVPALRADAALQCKCCSSFRSLQLVSQ